MVYMIILVINYLIVRKILNVFIVFFESVESKSNIIFMYVFYGIISFVWFYGCVIWGRGVFCEIFKNFRIIKFFLKRW